MGFWSNTILPTGHGVILVPHYNRTASDYSVYNNNTSRRRSTPSSKNTGAWTPYDYDQEGENDMAALKENAVKVFNYVKQHEDEGITAKDIAKALSLDPRSVNGIVTSAFQRKGLMERVPAEIENEDGTHTPVKLVKLTDAGKAFDPTAKDDAE